jgi:hypothetical protein
MMCYKVDVLTNYAIGPFTNAVQLLKFRDRSALAQLNHQTKKLVVNEVTQ